MKKNSGLEISTAQTNKSSLLLYRFSTCTKQYLDKRLQSLEHYWEESQQWLHQEEQILKGRQLQLEQEAAKNIMKDQPVDTDIVSSKILSTTTKRKRGRAPRSRQEAIPASEGSHHSIITSPSTLRKVRKNMPHYSMGKSPPDSLDTQPREAPSLLTSTSSFPKNPSEIENNPSIVPVGRPTTQKGRKPRQKKVAPPPESIPIPMGSGPSPSTKASTAALNDNSALSPPTVPISTPKVPPTAFQPTLTPTLVDNAPIISNSSPVVGLILSSIYSPVENLIMERNIEATASPIINVKGEPIIAATSNNPLLTIEQKPPEPKIEAWTSKFVKAPATKEAEKLNIGTLPLANGGQESNPIIRLASPGQPSMVVQPLTVDSTKIEFIPPATITRRLVRPPRDLPADYLESPLTRAKRIDAQNAWREQQLRTFLNQGTDNQLKTGKRAGLETLKPAETLGSGPIMKGPITTKESLIKVSKMETKENFEININKSTESAMEKLIDLPSEGSILAETLPILPDDDAIFDISSAFPTSGMSSSSSMGPPVASSSTTSISSKKITSIEVAKLESNSSPLIQTVIASPQEGEMVVETTEESSLFSSEKLSIIPANPLELEKRKRLKDRNEKALEKKRQLILKAQQLRANLTGKAVSEVSMRKKPINNGVALQKQAVLNSAAMETINNKVSAIPDPKNQPHPSHTETLKSIPSTMTMVATAGNKTPPRATINAGGEQVFKMPLPPKLKTPTSTGKPDNIKLSNEVVPAAATIGDHPSSDDTFTTLATTANDSSVGQCASPRLPHIPSDSSEDELAPQRIPNKDIRPVWAYTPEVSKILRQQRSIRPEDIFGEVEPVKLEDFFKNSGKKYTRGRTSSVWHP